MDIIILRIGALGALFGTFLSQSNDVTLVDVDARRIANLKQNGIKVKGKAEERVFHPAITTDSTFSRKQI